MSEALRIKLLNYIVKQNTSDFEDMMDFAEVINKEDDVVAINEEFQRIIRN